MNNLPVYSTCHYDPCLDSGTVRTPSALTALKTSWNPVHLWAGHCRVAPAGHPEMNRTEHPEF